VSFSNFKFYKGEWAGGWGNHGIREDESTSVTMGPRRKKSAWYYYVWNLQGKGTAIKERGRERERERERETGGL